MTKKNDNSLNFQIKAVKTLDFCITPPQIKVTKDIQFTIKIKTEFLVNIDKNVFAIRLTIDISEKDKNKIVSIRTESYFEIDNLKQFVIPDDQTGLVLPELLLSILLNMSIGTTRGILVTKVAGTTLGQLVMPAIPTKPLIPKEPIKIVTQKTK